MGFVHRTWWGWGKYSLSPLWSKGAGQLCGSPAPYEPLLQICSKIIHVKKVYMLLLHVHQQVRCALEEFSRIFFFSSKGSHISYKTHPL